MQTAKDVMIRGIVTIGEDATISEAIDLIVKHRISGLPVVDDGGRLLGLITQFALLAIVYDRELMDDPVSRHMTPEVIVVNEEVSLQELANLFILHRIRRVPVVREGVLIGQVSRYDVLRTARESMRMTPA